MTARWNVLFFKFIGVVSIGALTLMAAVTELSAQESNSLSSHDKNRVCSSALNAERTEWEQEPLFLKYVAEAKRRGLTVDSCRQLLERAYSASTSISPASTDSGIGLTTIFLIATAIAIYFLPAITAINRNHRNRKAIAVLIIFLGWTFVGWVIALVWSFTADIEEQLVIGPIQIEKDRGPDVSA